MAKEENTNTEEFRRKLNILVVEDNLAIQRVIEQILASHECHFEMAANGIKAMEVLEKNYYDLILMDLEMPEMNGFETTTRIRAQELITGKHVPILAMTGYHMENGRQKCINAGMDDYLEKPFNITELIETIERLTHKKLSSQ
ncbi:MAG TPA: response regulator [Bacillota bacterium]|nr:response regulator [Bacillota bacterium]